ncbi:GNAT family N-acetyltransferase [Streptomyces sp. NPDC002870]|uniref:GNAT family N-acetyltransferase n=1 Tax=Streptomyces sp. NPDC002870 TaxID=3364666 RepID=UPI0036935094
MQPGAVPETATASPYLAASARVGIRHYVYEDGEEFTTLAGRSTGHHRPWLFPPLTAEAYAAYARRLIEDPARAGFLVCRRAYAAYARRLIEDPARAGFLVCRRESGRIAGFININNIVEGGFRSGALGYGAFAPAVGHGLMGEGLGLVVRYAFGPMRLHRLEANIQPGNAASIALVSRAGFRLEGFSPDFLFIDGAWRDHERWAITSEMLDR